MAVGLFFEGEMCPDGVEMHCGGDAVRQLRPGVRLHFGDGELHYRSNRRRRYHHLADFSDPLVIKFVNARTENSLLDFLSEFGILLEPYYMDGSSHIDEERQVQKELRDTLKSRITDNFDPDGDEGYGRIRLAMDRQGGRINLSLKAEDILHYLWTEVAFILSGANGIGTCLHCAAVFVTGSKTHKNSKREYCSGRCRMAASRARRAPTAGAPPLP